MDRVFNSESAYASVALYACGNAVAIVGGLVLLGVWNVLSAFQAPILWAFIFSGALRDLKVRIVAYLDAELKCKSLPRMCLSLLLLLPVKSLVGGGSGFAFPKSKPPVAKPEEEEQQQQEQEEEEDESMLPLEANEGASEESGLTSGFIIGWLFRAVMLYALISKVKESWRWNLVASFLVSSVATFSAVGLALLVYVLSHMYLSRGKPAEADIKRCDSDSMSDSQDGSNPPSPKSGGASDAFSEKPPLRKKRSRKYSRIFGRGLCRLDRRVRRMLRSQLHTLVAVGLIMCVLVGSILVSIFMTVRIVEESRTAAAKVNEMIRTTHEQADLEGVWSVVQTYQENVLITVQANLPDMAQMVTARVEGFLKANNLSHAVDEAKELYGLFMGMETCNDEERRKLVVDVAAARLNTQSLSEGYKQQVDLLELHQQRFDEALKAWDNEWKTVEKVEPENAEKADIIVLERNVVDTSGLLGTAKEELNAMSRELDASVEALRLAEFKLERCEDRNSKHHSEGDSNEQKEILGRKLERAYSSLLEWRVSEAFWEVCSISKDFVDLARNFTGDNGGSMSSLQEAAYVISQPLMTIGQGFARAAATGIGSTTALAFTSGAGVLRLGMAFIKFAFQFILFGMVLLYLLAAEQDPFWNVIRLLPVSEANRISALDAVGSAMQAVFLSAIKLAAFHALFTWLTFRAFGIEFAYLSAVASLVMALLPLVPIWVIAMPAALQLFVQGNGLIAIVLVSMHFLAYNYIDDMILKEIPGSVPYLTALGIVGGIYTFQNPLQGAILGPMLLALLSVAYKLHWRFLSTSDAEVQGEGSTKR
ncbi:hypothetical protein BSKO_03085 [Bryopsis sp. KO-2023]|nr:hypothetical protein BSKO_03085 [Bryopsis sp. KO-2023]